MVKIVSKAISLANAPSLTDAELLIRAKDWAEELALLVPENRLLETFRRAVADHQSTFPINFYDLKTAYDKIAVRGPVDEWQFQKHLEERYRNG